MTFESQKFLQLRFGYLEVKTRTHCFGRSAIFNSRGGLNFGKSGEVGFGLRMRSTHAFASLQPSPTGGED